MSDFLGVVALVVCSWLLGTTACFLMWAGWTGSFETFGRNRAAFVGGAAILCAAVLATVLGVCFR